EASPWPDYVFTDNYDLKTIEEVSAFIAANGHLPNIPTAEEVEENGLAIGEMNVRLMEKIEELTLYTIEQQEKIKSQNESIKNQQAALQSLTERLEKLESSGK
ncbi:MAG: hypothetical protein WBA74_25590, partial [Cyclobacteriaceae bacterium]